MERLLNKTIEYIEDNHRQTVIKEQTLFKDHFKCDFCGRYYTFKNIGSLACKVFVDEINGKIAKIPMSKYMNETVKSRRYTIVDKHEKPLKYIDIDHRSTEMHADILIKPYISLPSYEVFDNNMAILMGRRKPIPAIVEESYFYINDESLLNEDLDLSVVPNHKNQAEFITIDIEHEHNMLKEIQYGKPKRATKKRRTKEDTSKLYYKYDGSEMTEEDLERDIPDTSMLLDMDKFDEEEEKKRQVDKNYENIYDVYTPFAKKIVTKLDYYKPVDNKERPEIIDSYIKSRKRETAPSFLPFFIIRRVGRTIKEYQ